MYAWGFESCRACLVSGDVATMYNLALPEIMELYNECSETNITVCCCVHFRISPVLIRFFDIKTQVLAAPLENIPLHICDMCYRLCGMMRSFKRRCQETEKKLSERSPQMPVQPEWVDEAVAEQVGVKEEPIEPYEQAQEDQYDDPLTNDESFTDPEDIQDFDDPSTRECKWLCVVTTVNPISHPQMLIPATDRGRMKHPKSLIGARCGLPSTWTSTATWCGLRVPTRMACGSTSCGTRPGTTESVCGKGAGRSSLARAAPQ